MTSIPAAHPVPQSKHGAVKAMAAAAIFAGACFGVYHGAQAITSHYQRPDITHAVSYADRATIDATLTGAWHTPATAGDFRADASIQTPDVVSVVRSVGR